MAKSSIHIKDLTPDPRNTRKHNPRNIGVIEKGLQELGAGRSILIDGNNEIIAGNGVVDAAINAGITKVRVVDVAGDEIVAVRRKDLTGKRKRRMAILDNRASDLSDWDEVVLQEIADSEHDLLDGLFTDEELAAEGVEVDQVNDDESIDGLIDRAAELQQKWQVKTGDLWQIGAHRLLCGDSTKREDVERVMPVDCTVTDPPYGVGVDYGEFKDTPENVKELMVKVMHIILEHLPAALTPGVPALMDYPKPAWIGAWVHPAPSGGCPWGFVGNNLILYYGADPYLKNGKGRRPDSIVMSSDRQGESGHPTSKPYKVWEWLVERLTPETGLIVFDPFAGSGTTGIACENLHRKARMIEISPNYCSVILQRFQDAFPNLSIERL